MAGVVRATYAGSALVVGTGLACGLGGGPPVLLDRPGFSMELIDGEVETDEDLGTSGDFDVSSGLTTQAVSWSAIDPDDTLEASAELTRTAMVAMMATEDLHPTDPNPPITSSLVDGQRALSFQIDVSGLTLRSTVFQCPDAGLEVVVNTSALGGESAHTHALESARCKHEPVVATERPASYRFVGPESRWSHEPGEQSTWTRDDGLVVVVVSEQSRIDEDRAYCRTMLDIAMDQMAFEVGARTPRDLARGCRLQAPATDPETGETYELVLIHDDCGGRGFISVCFDRSEAVASTVCDPLVTCVH